MAVQDIRQCRKSAWMVSVFLFLRSTVAMCAQELADDTSKTYTPLHVDSTPLPFRQFEKVEITGSSIVRKEQTQALPVQVITRQDIRRQGHTTLAQAIQNLPNVFNGDEFALMGADFNGFTNGALHGMPTGTLVLLNGKRLAPFGFQAIGGREQGNVDMGLIPLSAVERIEVLTDGASSLYGTDAIAGVINIITRTELKGIEVSVDHTRPSAGAGQGVVASLSWGNGQLARDGYSFRFNAEWDRYQGLQGVDRPQATQGRIGFQYGGQFYEADNSLVSPYTSPALIYSSRGTQNMVSGFYRDGLCIGNSVTYRNYEGGCKSNPLPMFGIYPASESQKVHALGEVLLGQGATLYGELFYARQDAQLGVINWPDVAGPLINKPGSPGYQEMVSSGLNPAYGRFYWRANLPALEERYNKMQSRIVVGVKGEYQDWNYNASLYHARAQVQHDYDYDLSGVFGVLGTQQNQALNNANLLQPLDAQNPLTAQLQALRHHWNPYQAGHTGLTGLELRASRPWFEWQGKDALVGWGIDVRQETADSQNFMETPVPWRFGGKRNDLAVYGEMQIPLRPDWDLIGSLRTDQYSDHGTTANAKLASRWAINSQWAVRGSVGTGFRAPSLGQMAVIEDPYILDTLPNFVCTPVLQAAASRLAAATGKDVTCRNNDVLNIFANGNPNLRPEKSRQTTLGIAFAPTRNWNLSADYWRVEMHDTLQLMSYDPLLLDPLNNPSQFVVDPKLIPNTTNTYRMGLLVQMQNLGQSLKEGIDVDMRLREPTDWGRWHLGLKATYLMQSKERHDAAAPWRSDLAAYSAGSNSVSPRWHTQGMLGLEQANTFVQMTLNYSSGYTDMDVKAYNTGTKKTEIVSGLQVPGFLTIDFLGTYQVNNATQVRLGVKNLWDRQPPLSFYSASAFTWGANSQNGSLYGRTLQLGATIKF